MENKETNLENVKEMTKLIAKTCPPKDANCFGIAIHPFVDNTVWFARMLKEGLSQEECNLLNPKVYRQWIKEFSKIIDSCNSLSSVYMYWRTPWKLTFMKYCGEFLSEKDYAEYLVNAWTSEENPNMDSNVSRKEAIKMFKSCKKEYLMSNEEKRYFDSLPEQITVYRGVGKNRIPLGLSWTDNKEVAIWFANRWKSENDKSAPKILTATVDKKNVIAYFDSRGEKELLLDVYSCKKQIAEL